MEGFGGASLFRGAVKAPIPRALIFDQDEWWCTRDGEWIKVADMTSSHRLNLAQFLLRNAEAIEFTHAMHDLSFMEGAPDEVVDDLCRRGDDPAAWMRATDLFRAITAGLKVDLVLTSQ